MLNAVLTISVSDLPSYVHVAKAVKKATKAFNKQYLEDENVNVLRKFQVEISAENTSSLIVTGTKATKPEQKQWKQNRKAAKKLIRDLDKTEKKAATTVA